MEKLIQIKQKMDAVYTSIEQDSKLQINKSNQSAAIRARKATLELKMLLKEFRKESINLSKCQTNKLYL